MPAEYVIFTATSCGHCQAWKAWYAQLPPKQQARWEIRNVDTVVAQQSEFGPINAYPMAFVIVSKQRIADPCKPPGFSTFSADQVVRFGRRTVADPTVRKAALLVAAVWLLKRIGF
jgi:hypothetical protein